MLQPNTAWRNSSVMELVDSEDESWINQPKFKLNDSDSESDEFDSRIGVAYLEAVAAMKQVGISESTVLELECSPAQGYRDTPVSVQNPSQPLVSYPSPSQQAAATAAQSPANETGPPAMMEIGSNANPPIAEAASSRQINQPDMPTAAAPPAVSMQDMPQLGKSVFEQQQYATARFDQPQPMTARVGQPQPATKSATAPQNQQQLTALKPQTAALQMNSLSPAVAATSEADQPLLATVEGSQPPQAAAAEMDSPPAATTSEVDEPQLATAVSPQPQLAMTQFLDMLFPPEQPRALPTKLQSSSLAGSSAVSEPPVPSRITEHSSTPDATTAAVKTSSAAPTDAEAPVPAAKSPSTAAEASATAAEASVTAADIAAPTATANASRGPLAAALHLSRPPMIPAAPIGTFEDAAIAATAAAAAADTATTATDACPSVSSTSEAVHTAQAVTPKSAAHPAKVLATSSIESAAAASVAVSHLSQLVQQIAQALAQAAIQLVQDAPRQVQHQQPLPPAQQHWGQVSDSSEQQPQQQQLPKQQLQQQLTQQPQPQQQQQQQPPPPKQQQQSQQLQQDQQQQQESLAAMPSRELVPALHADTSDATPAASLAMNQPALPANVPHSGLLPVPAVPMATDTPEAAALFPPVLSSASASAASAPALLATMLPSYSTGQKLNEVGSGGGTRTVAVAWPSSGTWPGKQTHKPPLLQGAVPPPVGAPVPTVPVAPPLQPPPTAWPQLPAWPSQWAPHPWGQPPPAPASQYQRPVIAPPAPPPGGPPPPPTSSTTVAPLPPPLPVAPSHLTSRPQKRKGLPQQQRPAAKRQKAPAGGSRVPQNTASNGSVGSVDSNSKQGKDHPGSFPKTSSDVANKSSGGGHPANTAARSAGRPGQRVRQRLRRQSQLADGAQGVHAGASSGKAKPGVAPQEQRDQRQLSSKSQGKKGKSKGQVRKAFQKARKGAHNKQGYVPQKQYPK